MNINKYTIKYDDSVKNALQKLQTSGKRILFVVDEQNTLRGSISDGDVRRWILQSGDLQVPVEHICNPKPITLSKNYNPKKTKNLFLKQRLEALPIINNNNKIEKILFWENLFQEKTQPHINKIDCPVVIMAGGKGSRMEPFTHILPKPLIPIGNKPMIEIIMDEYHKFGMKNFYLSVNFKANMIKAYFEDQQNQYQINYVQETSPLGTAGSLKLLENKISTTFFVSNCDILIKNNYREIYDFHKKGNYMLTMVASMQKHIIPYGVCETNKDGELIKITEKPEYNFLANTGMYILEPETLQQIPKNKFFHITDLMRILQDKKYKVGVYPVSKEAYVDVGQWDLYQDAVKTLLQP